jgi:sialate O-acetylesterase
MFDRARFGAVRFGTLALLAVFGTTVRAEVRTHALVSDGMVLQQQKPVRVWGTAAAGEKVTVEFREQSVSTTTPSDGRWQVELAATAAGGPFPLVIRGENELRFDDVYVGEVWVCSGQSNMGWPVATRPGSKELLGTENAKIRLFTVPPRLSNEPEADLSADDKKVAKWQACGPDTLVGFSAVAYYFGQELAEKLNVPIGLIHASYGGSPVDQWIEREALAALKRNETPPPAARPGGRVALPTTSRLYNGMIAPLLPYGIRGVIWYQGEADVGRADRYEQLFSALIANWRQDWKQGAFPFLFVQIAPYGKIVAADAPPAESQSARLREAQLNVSCKVDHAGMAVVTDWGHETDIHVKQKKPVGHRLALLARATVYGENVEYSGPTLEKITMQDNQAILRFAHADGLTAKRMAMENFSTDPRTGSGGSLHVVAGDSAEPIAVEGFTIAGRDLKFVRAKAEIRGRDVVVSSPDVAEPASVRYGWADYPTGNLFNAAGLPASPFRIGGRPLDGPSPPLGPGR